MFFGRTAKNLPRKDPPMFTIATCNQCPKTGGCANGCDRLRQQIPNAWALPPMTASNRGWICPRCERVNAPHSLHCDCPVPLSSVATTLAS